MLVILITYIGINFAKIKKTRMEVFSQFYEFNEQLILNLKFSRFAIDKIAKHFNYVMCVLENEPPLKGDDEEFLKDYFYNLGKTDALSQIDYLNERKAILKKYKDETYADYKKSSSMYTKIFFLIGVTVAILLA